MHYAEGSLMPLMGHFAAHEQHQKWLGALLLKLATNAIVGTITSLFLAPNFKTHYTFLEDQLGGLSGSGPISVREGFDRS
jgi:glutathione S-transferase